VAGAIPVIRPLTQSLAGDTVLRVAGIVNGTTNYILSAMDSTGADYASALADAGALGYAKPTRPADVEGYDAAAKAAILASIAFHTRVTADDVYREGIPRSALPTSWSARALGCTIKLLAICERLTTDEGQQRVSARVYPALVPLDHPLAAVNGAFNAVVVEGGGRGSADVYGQGAGGAPTASAVMGESGDGCAQPRAGRSRPARVEVRQAADFADRLHPHPLLRQHERHRPPRRVVLCRS